MGDQDVIIKSKTFGDRRKEDLPKLIIGDVVLMIEPDPISEEVAEIAKRELRETPEIAEPAKKELLELLEEEHDLTLPLDDEDFLVAFLRPCKFYPESACELIKRCYKFKVKHKTLYDGLKPSNEKNIFEQNLLTILPYRDQHFRRILLIEAGGKWNTSKCTVDEIFKGVVLMLEAAVLEPTTQVCGGVLMIDLQGLGMTHVWQFSPSIAKRLVDLVQECLPVRLKGIHIVNQPYIFKVLFAIFKPFLNQKIKDRLFFHGKDREALFAHIDPKYLPKRYGGLVELPDVTGQQWYEVLSQCDADYDLINSFGYGKSKIIANGTA